MSEINLQSVSSSRILAFASTSEAPVVLAIVARPLDHLVAAAVRKGLHVDSPVAWHRSEHDTPGVYPTRVNDTLMGIRVRVGHYKRTFAVRLIVHTDVECGSRRGKHTGEDSGEDLHSDL